MTRYQEMSDSCVRLAIDQQSTESVPFYFEAVSSTEKTCRADQRRQNNDFENLNRDQINLNFDQRHFHPPLLDGLMPFLECLR